MNKSLPDAFSFKCSLDRKTIREKFEAVGAYEWKAADSDTYGSYLWARPTSQGWPARFRLYCEAPEDYLFEFQYSYSALAQGQTADHVVAFVKDQLLPAIGATDVKETSGIR